MDTYTRIKKVSCDFIANILKKIVTSIFPISLLAYFFKDDSVSKGEAATGVFISIFILLAALYFKLKGEFYE